MVSAARLFHQGRLACVIEVDALAAWAPRSAGGAGAVPDFLGEGDPRPAWTDERLPLDQRHPRLRAPHVDVEHGPAHADRRAGRRDDVGALVQFAGREPKDAPGEIDRHLLAVRLSHIDELVEGHA